MVYQGGIQLAARWNPKARLWVLGRKQWEEQLLAKWEPDPNGNNVWMHCASLGEFEQGRPLLEAIRKDYPGVKILLTFFSPSGYEIRKQYAGADAVCYLPFDSAGNARRFLDIVQPRLAIFVKYEFWHFYLQELNRRNIATLLVSGIFRAEQPFFQWWGGFHRNMLHRFSHLFVQNEASRTLLIQTGFGNCTTVAGDTRFDRVTEVAAGWQPIEQVTQFCGNHFVLVAGSTWPEDETLLAAYLNDHWNNQKLIIAPHEIKPERLARLKELFPDSVLFSELQVANHVVEKQCLIIDNIGYLSRLYKYADVCYVGGGFNKSGHHNILEAAVYGKAVLTGPNYQKFKESVDLKTLGGSFMIRNQSELKQTLLNLDLQKAGALAAAYVREQSGATKRILNWIQEKRLFTNE